MYGRGCGARCVVGRSLGALAPGPAGVGVGCGGGVDGGVMVCVVCVNIVVCGDCVDADTVCVGVVVGGVVSATTAVIIVGVVVVVSVGVCGWFGR